MHYTHPPLPPQTLRDLVLDPEGQRLATCLIAALVGEQLDGSDGSGGVGGVDELAGLLQARAPAFFKDQDRRFYQVGFGGWRRLGAGCCTVAL
jgi:hypothetical protein